MMLGGENTCKKRRFPYQLQIVATVAEFFPDAAVVTGISAGQRRFACYQQHYVHWLRCNKVTTGAYVLC